MRKIALVLVLVFLPVVATPVPTDFRQYWYQGKGELTRYSLEQARYGEIHKGESVLIFVTEPFLKTKQVKLESGKSEDAVSVLKLNLTKKFYTGIYPYSLMTSVFSPVDFQKYRTLKVSSSTQEWCGNTFSQLNFKNNTYEALIRSYFEEEGDQNITVKGTWLEDEIWTRIRLAPETLPVGNFEVIPGLQFVRLGHVDLKVEPATAEKKSEGNTEIYTLQYKNLKRALTIRYDKAFPHIIQSWEEKSQSLTTRAVRTKTIMLDYWNKNGVADAPFRKQLGLTE